MVWGRPNIGGSRYDDCHSSQTLVIGELKPEFGGDGKLLAPLIVQHRRTGVCPVGVTVNECMLSVFTLKCFSSEVYIFTKVMYCISNIDEVAALLDNVCEKAASIEAEETLHSHMGSLSLESGEVVEVGRAGESPLRELITSLSETVASLRQQVTELDTRLAGLEQMQTTENSRHSS